MCWVVEIFLVFLIVQLAAKMAVWCSLFLLLLLLILLCVWVYILHCFIMLARFEDCHRAEMLLQWRVVDFLMS